jgi:cell division protein FtsI (penicillin-binding protein 3)
MFTRFFRWERSGPARDAAAGGEQAADSALRRVVAGSPLLDPLGAAGAPPDTRFEAEWRDVLRRRVVLVLAGLALWAAGLEARLVHLQVVQHEEMKALAVRQQEREITLIPPRGDIVDRNGQMLAYSVDGHALVADPNAVDDPAATAAQICRALADCTVEKRAGILRNLTRRTSFAYLDRQISPDQSARLEALKLGGVRLIPEPRRYYPKLELAAHVLGFVGIDNEGLGGVERTYDDIVRGTPGQMLLQVDARRKRMDSRVQQAPAPGATLELTLDLYLQHIVERELRTGVEDSRARGGTAIVMDPHNGEILALASYPTFNPNAYRQSDENDRRNRAIQDVYEPGSTFKIVTASAALEDGVVRLDELIDTNPGVITFQGRKPITEAKHHNYGVLSVEDVIVRSSNVGAIKIGLRVGADRLSRYVQAFGFGQALLPDLAGQSRGIVWNPKKINDSALASMSMGYQVGVTPVQMISAASVVANGGVLYQPHVVRAIVRGTDRQPVPIKPLRRVISTETAGKLTTIMEGVVERVEGTGKAARLDGFQVAGKTGTAAKLVNGRYSATEYNVSFVGFVPSRRPALSILVVIDTPRNGSPYGGTIAAPIFRRIADAALRQLAVPPTINPPPVVLASARSGMGAQTISVPAVASSVVSSVGGSPVMPDVRGLSARDALRVLTAAGLTVRVSGSGFVVAQTPAAGEPIESGTAGALELRRRTNESGEPR